LSPATRSTARRAGSNAKATRQTPPAASKRSSFKLAWRDPSSVSTRGRRSVGQNCASSLAWASSSLDLGPEQLECRVELVMKDDRLDHAGT
jgi:hypothetical protein